MSEMLTAKEMQDLLQVDRSTIYRMAESGKLPAIKVGKQWRFPSEQVDNWFHGQVAKPAASPSANVESRTNGALELAELLPIDCVQLIQDSFADLLGIMVVVTDMEGNPITSPSHACGLFEAISQEPFAVQKCIQSWREMATTIDLEPRFTRSHLGLLCARALIRDGVELKGMVVGGCVAPNAWPPTKAELLSMAENLDVEPELIEPHLSSVYFWSREDREMVLFHLQRMANIVAHIVNERKALVGRLEAIADLTTI
jgi:excisionase family DNA binding protein